MNEDPITFTRYMDSQRTPKRVLLALWLAVTWASLISAGITAVVWLLGGWG